LLWQTKSFKSALEKCCSANHSSVFLKDIIYDVPCLFCHLRRNQENEAEKNGNQSRALRDLHDAKSAYVSLSRDNKLAASHPKHAPLLSSGDKLQFNPGKKRFSIDKRLTKRDQLTVSGGRPPAAPPPIMTAVPHIPTSSVTQIMQIIAHDLAEFAPIRLIHFAPYPTECHLNRLPQLL